VDKELNLTEYIKSLADYVSAHVDTLPEDICWLVEYDQDELVQELTPYFEKCGDDLRIIMNTEDDNHNSQIWAWLCDKVRVDLMKSKLMQTISTTVDSKYGVDSTFDFTTKSGKYITVHDIIKLIEQSDILVDG
jgi:hypothetical protein